MLLVLDLILRINSPPCLNLMLIVLNLMLIVLDLMLCLNPPLHLSLMLRLMPPLSP